MEENTELELLDQHMGTFDIILNGENKKKGDLWLSWHYLQLYATWGLRLPSSDEELKLKLNIDNPGAYLFFEPMKKAYQDIDEACGYFMTTTFPGMVAVGSQLRSFAREATNDGEMFQAIIDSVDEDDKPAAIDFITYLQDLAWENVKKAEEVSGYLAEFGVKLTRIQGLLKDVHNKLDADEKTTQSTIDTLRGDADITGSLKQMEALLATQEDEYDHNVVVAATTVTYAWIVIPPVGLITAAVVAGVFGDKAVKALEEVEKTKELLQSKSKELNQALASRSIQALAQSGIDNAQINTNIAIEKTNMIKIAWQGIYANLGTVKNKLFGMLQLKEDDTVALVSARAVKKYALQAEEAWAALLPDLDQLMAAPYITVEPGEQDINQLIASVKAHVPVAA